MIRSSMCIVFAAVSALYSCANPSYAPHDDGSRVASTGARTIDDLLERIASSDGRFEYLVSTKMHVDSGPALAERLRRQFVDVGSSDISVNQFIDRFATESDRGGSKYRVRLSDGSHVDLAEWLRAQLAQ